MIRTDPLPGGLALLLLGLGVAGITAQSLSANDVGIARSEWSALLALVLAAPAIALYVLEPGPPGSWWRAFWTAGAAAYLLHFWWAVFGTYNGNFSAILARQGFVAITNFAVTILWPLDAILAWAGPDWPNPTFRRALRFVAWIAVTLSFITAAAVFRTGSARTIGIALGAIVVLALLARILGLVQWKPEQQVMRVRNGSPTTGS
jgi:hypothetical protein